MVEIKPRILEMDASNGVGICVINHQDKVMKVCRTSDRVMAVKIVL